MSCVNPRAAKSHQRVHSRPKPTPIAIALDFFVDADSRRFELGRFEGHVLHSAAGGEHPILGWLRVGEGQDVQTTGRILWQLPAPEQLNRKPPTKAEERDVAYLLAGEFFKASRVKAFARAWRKNALELLGSCTGITEGSHVTHAAGRANEYLAKSALARLVFRGNEVTDSRVVHLESGARIDPVPGHPDRCVIRGPHWVWVYGEKKPTHHAGDEWAIEIQLKSPVPGDWFELGRV